MRGSIWRGFGPPSGLVLPLLVALCEASWLALWVGLLSEARVFASHRPVLHGPAIFGLLLVVSFATRRILRSDWSICKARLAILEAAALTILAVLVIEYAGLEHLMEIGSAPSVVGHDLTRLSPLLAALLIAAALAWWGVRLGRSPLNFDDVYTDFLLGLFAFLALLVVLSVSNLTQRFVSGAVPAALIFFSAGLVSLALARLGDVQEASHAERGEDLRLNRRWLAVLFGLVGVLVLLTLVLSSLISLSALRVLLEPVGSFFGWASNGLFYLLLPFGYLVMYLIYAARFLLSLFGAGQHPQPPQPITASNGLRDLQSGNGLALSPQAVLIIKVIGLAIIALAVLLVLARSVFRYWQRDDQDGVVELHESVFDGGEFWASVRAFLRRLLARWRKARPPMAPAEPPDAGLSESEPSARTVREIYRRLLVRLLQRGLARAPEQTPYDYLRGLRQSLNDDYRGVETITEAYIQARYGERPLNRDELQDVQRAWVELDLPLSDTDTHNGGRSGKG